MNYAKRQTFLICSVICAFLLWVSSCKSAVSTRTNASVDAGKTNAGKEATAAKGEDKIKRAETEESVKQRAIGALKIMKENAPKVRLNEYFNAIANADNAAIADLIITRALTMFASSKTTVLIEISELDGKSNYDKPTTILAYFTYLKTQKKNLDDIRTIKTDANGKIIEVELKKNNLIPLRSGGANQ